MVNEGQIAKCMWNGGFEEAERDFAVKAIKPGMKVLNIGANAGLYTIIASKTVGPFGQVHAFEPSSQNFDLLNRNIKINNCQNVTPNRLALSDFQGKLSLHRDRSHPDMDGHFFVRRILESHPPTPEAIEEIPCTMLDDYWLAACDGVIQPVDFIVIDVEGAELSVFNGAKKTISASPNVVMIMECTEHINEIRKFLVEFDFSCYQWDIASNKLISSEIERGSFIVRRKLQAA
jgi:FkbM family methyltransferase